MANGIPFKIFLSRGQTRPLDYWHDVTCRQSTVVRLAQTHGFEFHMHMFDGGKPLLVLNNGHEDVIFHPLEDLLTASVTAALPEFLQKVYAHVDHELHPVVGEDAVLRNPLTEATDNG